MKKSIFLKKKGRYLEDNVHCVQTVTPTSTFLGTGKREMCLEVPEMENHYERHGHFEPPFCRYPV